MRALFDHFLVNFFLKNAKNLLLGPKSVSDVRKTCSKMLKFAHSKNSIGLIFFSFSFRNSIHAGKIQIWAPVFWIILHIHIKKTKLFFMDLQLKALDPFWVSPSVLRIRSWKDNIYLNSLQFAKDNLCFCISSKVLVIIILKLSVK